jgi:hypothetical protein
MPRLAATEGGEPALVGSRSNTVANGARPSQIGWPEGTVRYRFRVVPAARRSAPLTGLVS